MLCETGRVHGGMDMGFLDDVKKAAQDAGHAVQRQVDNLQKPPAPPEPPPVDGPATTSPLEPPLMAGAPPEAPVAPAPFTLPSFGEPPSGPPPQLPSPEGAAPLAPPSPTP